MAPVALPIGMAAAGAVTKGIGAYKGAKNAKKQNEIRKIQTAWEPWTNKPAQEYTPSPSMLGSVMGGAVEGAQIGTSINSAMKKPVPFGAVTFRDGKYYDQFGKEVI